jgi:Immunoglobulin-like domain of bacterial spore germination/Sporulation and spore germination
VTRGRAAAAFLLCTLAAGCGGTSQPAGTGPGETTTGAATRTVDVYYLRGNELVPVHVSVAETPAIATASLEKLLSGAPEGYTSAIPSRTALESVAVSDGRATVRFSTDRLTHTAEGQIVYTLTQFPSITAVDGGPFSVPAGREDFADLTSHAAIFVAEPERDSAVSSPVHASGTADVFEGTLAVDVWSGGTKLRTQPIQASSGTGTRGSWKATIVLPPGQAKLVFYEPSAENGQPLHATTVLLTVR